MRLIPALAAMLAATAGAQQYQLDAEVGNRLFLGGVPFVAEPPVTDVQGAFSAMGPVSSASHAVATSSVHAQRYPSNTDNSIVLQESYMGGTFASGVPRYLMGEQMVPPFVQVDGVTPAASGYWRAKPVMPGETIPGHGIPIPVGSVNVLSASTNSQTVEVESVPSQLLIGATLLGQPVTNIVGTTVTLGGNSKTNITSSTASTITPSLTYYYSPHAEKVFATQPGRVVITWVTRVPTSDPNHGIKTEIFAVSANASKPTRTMYWTDSGFDGPQVAITDGRIKAVNPVYYNQVPKAVPEEVSIPGLNPITPNLKTLYYEKISGSGVLKAYNCEGRIFVEYLGEVRLGVDIHEFIGFDIVDIKRTPRVDYVQTHLGKEILPHDGDTSLTPSPVLTSAQTGASYYGTSVRSDNTLVYHAEKATSPVNDPDDGNPASDDAYNQVVFYWMETGSYGIQWPRFQDRYWLRWSPDLADYAHYTVDSGGSDADTGISFSNGVLPQLVYQDDPAQAEAKIDLATQRLFVDFGPNNDRNRSLLKFSSGADVWYVNLYTQAEDRKQLADATVQADSLTVDVGSTDGLEVGMVVSGGGVTGAATITAILNDSQIVVSHQLTPGSPSLGFTVESDASAPLTATAYVGSRIEPPAGHEIGGYISAGSAYHPGAYLNPFVTGVAAAGDGAILPVNADPDDQLLTVRWFRKVEAPTASFESFYVPGKVGRYTLEYPTTVPSIVIAQGLGTGNLPAAQAAGEIYYQNDSTQPGYNPNEEHALMLGGRAYALRDDLNVVSGVGYTSEPCILISYEEPGDQRPAMAAYRVQRESSEYRFDYAAVAGTLLNKPYPLPLMPLPLVQDSAGNWVSKDVETGIENPTNSALSSSPAYSNFTFEDRKGFTWIHRGPHDPHYFVSASYGNSTARVDVSDTIRGLVNSGSTLLVNNVTLGSDPAPNEAKALEVRYRTTRAEFIDSFGEGETFTPQPLPMALSMQLYYPSRDGFFLPGHSSQPDVGTILPFLRDASRSGTTLNLNAIEIDQGDEPLVVTYRPEWPTNAPKLRIGETLTLPKFGLPQVRGQLSAEVLYQQSLALNSTADLTTTSVMLHDATREKTYALDTTLPELPASILTTNYQGKVYFQGLPAHLQKRIYLDPLRGTKGSLVLLGEFHDLPAGEDYLDLNVLSAKELAAIKGLVAASDAKKSGWDSAIEALSTVVETFHENPARRGEYIPNSTLTSTRTASQLTLVGNDDTAVDSYALTATGKGSGFVTMIFGNGEAFTPEGDPVQVKVLQVEEQLYTGDLKAIYSDNPLDEQVTLRHSGDFAARTEDYEFDWRWTTGDATAPSVYQNTMARKIGQAGVSANWQLVSDPGAMLPDGTQYASASTYGLPRSIDVAPSGYSTSEQDAGFPALVLRSTTGADFTGGVPGTIVFSAKLGSLDGFVLYVNGVDALAHNAPADYFDPVSASAGITAGGLEKQFSLAPSFFAAGPNTIDVAVYSQADPGTVSSLDFVLEAATEADVVTAAGTAWQSPSDPSGRNDNIALIGGSTLNPFGGPQFVLNDRWFTMRYRPKTGTGSVMENQWSRWMPPQLVEGWIKRVLAGINPFEQRMKDLYNNAIDTDVSVITQAGTRWEGDVALTLDNITDVGLIEIYETVLNRGRSMSIDANVNDSDTNNALLLAAGYLNDLYTLLGNEAFADAANPTISVNDASGAAEVNTSRFAFEAQVANSLDEELALLRGRDDFVSPGVRSAPGYNRLYWNYTRGINSGEVIYAVNYNIREKAGSSTADGVIDEADAQRMFPQGHGDAYGHYLTAIKGYYRLMQNANFDWQPRAEAVTVLGQPVTIDYMDERKFAAAASNLARTAQQVVNLTYRQSYQDDPAAGWASYRDDAGTNSQTGVTRRQGLDEWVSRSAQGALYHWAVANAIVPAEDIVHQGVQKIDRTTVPEIPLLASALDSIQTTIDNANAHLNPLGLSSGAIAFDISPTELEAGNSHFEQVYQRALRSLNNAAGAFRQAAVMTRSLRNQETQLDDFNSSIIQQEFAYRNALIETFGRAYDGDVGAGKLYAQGYDGPDLYHWFIVDQPNDLVNPSETFEIIVQEPVELLEEYNDPIQNIINKTDVANFQVRQVTVQPSQFVQFNKVWESGGLGSRPETGALQEALLDAQSDYLVLRDLSETYADERDQLRLAIRSFNDLLESQRSRSGLTTAQHAVIVELDRTIGDLESRAAIFDGVAEIALSTAEALAEAFPKSIGLATDATSAPRSVAKLVGVVAATISKVASVATTGVARNKQTTILETEFSIEDQIATLEFSLEARQAAYELESLYIDHLGASRELLTYTLKYQRSLQQVRNVLSKGQRLLEEREIFRQRAAAVIQGYRTNDLSFRLFRNEALEQYRSLYDLAGRYCYLAAKSYDYETGLLGSSAGQQVFNDLVASRSLGDLTGGQPQSTTSTLGDSGLAGTMARLVADFSVAEGRLGINNPDQYGTVFSLRKELFRLLDDPSITADDEAWRQTLEMHIKANVLDDADVMKHCGGIAWADGSAVPGIVLPFSSTIAQGKNFFGLPIAGGDHAYTTTNYATKIHSVGISLPGYVGMDPYASGDVQAGAPAGSSNDSLSATPYVYLIPCGSDYMLAPPLGDSGIVRAWQVADQALPLPYNLGASDFNSTQFFTADGTLSEQPWILRKHQAFRAVADPSFFYSRVPAEFTNSRLVGRSVWNGQWKIVIPAYTLFADAYEGLNRFVRSVDDVQLFLRTYSHSGN